MKKLIIGLCLFGMLIMPVSAGAEMTVDELSAQITKQIEALQVQLQIQLLLQKIADLQAQITEMLAAQASQTVTINQQTATIQAQGAVLEQVALNTTPSGGTVVEPPVVATPLSVTCSGAVASLDDPNFEADFIANATGGDGNYQYYWDGSGIFGRTGNCSVNGPHAPDMTFSDAVGALESNCAMTGSSTFVGRSQSIPPSSINFQKGNPPSFYWPAKNRISTKTDWINIIMTVWVKDGSNIVGAHCPITVN